ncbi:MAG: DUF6884 domain-containing protein [bacterium]
MKISLISCSKKKKKGELKAANKYNSPLFKKSLQLAKLTSDKVYILSAKYHLLELEEKIKDYDLNLNDFSKKDRISWAKRVYRGLKHKIKQDDILIFYAGQKYYEDLLPLLRNPVKLPLDGMGIGKRLKYLTDKLEGFDENK